MVEVVNVLTYKSCRTYLQVNQYSTHDDSGQCEHTIICEEHEALKLGGVIREHVYYLSG